MKKILIIFLIIVLSFCFLFWYSTFDGKDYFEFLSQGIKLDKVYSGEDFSSPAKEFRNDVIRRLESHIVVPENYDFYFSEKLNSYGWYYGRSYTLHMGWIDENGFSYNIVAETYYASLSGAEFVRIDVYKQGIISPLTFEDYIPSVYFYQGGYDYKENKYATEEPDFVDEMRRQVNLVIKNPELTLADMNLPVIEIVKRPLEEEGKETIIGVRVLSKDKEGKFRHEYDYNGDGSVDEVKISENIQGSAQELAEKLGLSHTVEYNRWKILPDDKYEYFPRDSGFTTSFVFDDPNPQPMGGTFREGATRIEINGETEEMMIRFFP